MTKLKAVREKRAQREPLPGPWPGAWAMDDEEVKAVTEVMRAKSPFRHYGPGVLGKARQFEKAFATRIGVRYALGVTSGTAALIVGLSGLEVVPDAEVIMPAHTWIACPSAVIALGGVPVLAEIDESLTLDAADVEKRITPRTKAIMAVHLTGVAADMERIMAVAKKHGLKVLEDCAQSCGASFHGKPVGSIGNAGAFSLQINKIITTGDGGALTTSDPLVYERAVRCHDLGFVREQFEIQEQGKAFFGNNYRMNELSGAVALVQLGKLDKIVRDMRAIKAGIIERILDLPGIALRKVPDPEGDAAAALTIFAPTSKAADCFIAALGAENLPSGKPYGGKALYENWPDCFQGWLAERQALGARAPEQSYSPGLCPRTEALLKRTIAIPLVPTLTKQHVDSIAERIRSAWQAGG
jgi:8-amino-3,8-dideoxy-alpha-D-manno-octulosonate transaminase